MSRLLFGERRLPSRICDQFLFVHAMQPEEQFRLPIEPDADAIENRRSVLAHIGPVRTAAGKVDFFR